MVYQRHAGALYVDLPEGQRRCFYEELEPEESVVVYYGCEALNPEKRLRAYRMGGAPGGLDARHFHPIGINVVVTNPEGFLIHQETLAKETDAFDFTALELPGEHSICFQTNTSHYWGNENFRLKVDVHTGVEAKAGGNPWEDPAGEVDDMLDLQKKAAHLRAKLQEVRDAGNELMERDTRFRQTSDSTYRRVAVSFAVQIGLLVGLALAQLYSLKQLFLQRKLANLFPNLLFAAGTLTETYLCMFS
eukprot:EG_transcript_25427